MSLSPLPIMKAYSLLTLAICLSFFGCATDSGPPPPRPFMGILDGRKIEGGPDQSPAYEVVVHYEDVEPGKYEIKIGFGYTPTDEGLKAMAQADRGLYAIAHSEVLQSASGDLRVTLEPKVVQDQKGIIDGKIHAILSKYPHGKEWLITKHHVFVLPR